MKHLLNIVLAVTVSLPATAQVLPFNDAGVTMGHHHIMVPDIDAQTIRKANARD